MRKLILDLCGGTGAWSKPYKDAGYDVRLITLPAYDVTMWRDYPAITTPMHAGAIYGILAAPPCTMFSLARSTGGKRDLRSGMRVVNSCLEIVQETIFNAYDRGSYRAFRFWAMENPKGYLDKHIGRPAYSFSPWEFGDPYFKQTHVWGYFNPPKKTPGIKPGKFDRVAWASPKAPEEYKYLKLDRAGIRAITPKGFAQAFFKANQ